MATGGKGSRKIPLGGKGMPSHSGFNKPLTEEQVDAKIALANKKIQELSLLLEQESALIKQDTTKELIPIYEKQKEIESRIATKRREAQAGAQKTQHASSSSATSSQSRSQLGKYTKAVSGKEAVPFLTKSQSQPKLCGRSSGFSRTVLPNQEGNTNSSKPNEDNQKVDKSLVNSSKPTILSDTAGLEKKLIDNKDSSWYGSLGRNWTRKKRNGPGDKNHKGMPLSGSIAGLDLHEKEELKPDEHYEIGLPCVPVNSWTPSTRLQSAEPLWNPPKLPPKYSSTSRLSKNGGCKNLRSNQESGIKSSAQPIPLANLFNNESAERTSCYPPFEFPYRTTKPKNFRADVQVPPTQGNHQIQSNGDNLEATKMVRVAHPTPTPVPVAGAVPRVNISGSGISPDDVVSHKESSKPFEMADYYKYSSKYREAGKQLNGGGGNCSNEQLPITERDMKTPSPVPQLPPRANKPLSTAARLLLIDKSLGDEGNCLDWMSSPDKPTYV